MQKFQMEDYLHFWYPGLKKDDRTLASVMEEMPGYEQSDIPWLVWLLENPKSPIAMPGYINLFNHDCIHILLGRGLLPQDEAFVIGFTMGNNTKVKKWHAGIFKFFSLYFYPINFKLEKKDLFAYDLGFEYGRSRSQRNLNKINFQEHFSETIGEIRSTYDISRQQLIELRQKEAAIIPNTEESNRLLQFD